MKKPLNWFLIIVLLLAAGWLAFYLTNNNKTAITNFEQCAAAGNPVMESYPRQCRANNRAFVEDIGNEPEKADLIRLDNPRPNQKIDSPLEITGQARGNWFFEAGFPIFLEDQYGNRFAQSIAQAQSDWMTSGFVPFKATLNFDPTKPYDLADPGSFQKTLADYNRDKTLKVKLILKKDNPSGLPEHDDELIVPIKF